MTNKKIYYGFHEKKDIVIIGLHDTEQPVVIRRKFDIQDWDHRIHLDFKEYMASTIAMEMEQLMDMGMTPIVINKSLAVGLLKGLRISLDSKNLVDGSVASNQ